MTFQNTGDVAVRLDNTLKPVTYEVPLQGSVAAALRRYAAKEGKQPETIIAEAVRSYMGDAA
ncbi:MAG: hypothetical protein AB7S74_18850 [Hyphomicrobium sp.]